MQKTNIQIYDRAIDLSSLYSLVRADNCGAINQFVGTVRNITKDKKVVKLFFEAYEPMALKELQKIAEHCIDQWSIGCIAIHHRLGELSIGEIAVAILVASPHRDAGFKACQYAIDQLKVTVPIWKKEYFEDGDIWVAAHP
ncbi:UNVERIFIED_CONTAM: hypothetical protein GTU68_052817 [Idotea baltica]|nr:hypothetical protein [Idotea baltica]